MLPELNKIKGIPPGIILKWEIKKRGLKNKDLAIIVNEHPQTISAILKEKRSITPGLSIKLGESFNVDADYFMLLQASYDVKKAGLKNSIHQTPNLRKIRQALFWDTDFNTIDWYKSKRAILKRIFERGNEQEIKEIINFYGFESVKSEVAKIKDSQLHYFDENVKKYIQNDII